MPNKIYVVELTTEERNQLKRSVNTGSPARRKAGKAAAYKQRHALILLLADQGPEGPAMKDDQITKAVGCGIATVERVRKQLVTEGLEAALQRQKVDRSCQRLLDGDAEAHLIALACSQPPRGRNRWTLRLLAEKMVELEIVGHCSKDTVHQTLKKTNLSLGEVIDGAFRQKLMLRLSVIWRMCWMFIKGHITQSVHRFALMKDPSS